MSENQKVGLTRRDLFKKTAVSAAGAALMAAGLETDKGQERVPSHLRNDAVEIICVLDRSGSMRGEEEALIDGFNKFLGDQGAEPGAAALTVVLFDHEFDVVHERANLRTVPLLDSGVYFPRGQTALWDAMGRSIGIVRGNVPESKKVIVLVMTDGFENASREYDGESLKSLIQEQEAVGWKFMFIGADVDAITMAGAIGLGQSAYVTSLAGMLGATGPVGPTGSAGISGSVGLGMAAMSVGTSSFRRSGEVNLDEWEEVPDEET